MFPSSKGSHFLSHTFCGIFGRKLDGLLRLDFTLADEYGEMWHTMSESNHTLDVFSVSDLDLLIK